MVCIFHTIHHCFTLDKKRKQYLHVKRCLMRIVGMHFEVMVVYITSFYKNDTYSSNKKKTNKTKQ